MKGMRVAVNMIIHVTMNPMNIHVILRILAENIHARPSGRITADADSVEWSCMGNVIPSRTNIAPNNIKKPDPTATNMPM